jgi:hypothetical protein
VESQEQRRLQAMTATNQLLDVLKQTSTILQVVRDIPKAIADMQDSAFLHRAQENRRLKRMDRKLTLLIDDVSKIDAGINNTVSLISTVGSRVSQTLIRLFELMTEIKKLVQL